MTLLCGPCCSSSFCRRAVGALQLLWVCSAFENSVAGVTAARTSFAYSVIVVRHEVPAACSFIACKQYHVEGHPSQAAVNHGLCILLPLLLLVCRGVQASPCRPSRCASSTCHVHTSTVPKVGRTLQLLQQAPDTPLLCCAVLALPMRQWHMHPPCCPSGRHAYLCRY